MLSREGLGLKRQVAEGRRTLRCRMRLKLPLGMSPLPMEEMGSERIPGDLGSR